MEKINLTKQEVYDFWAEKVLVTKSQEGIEDYTGIVTGIIGLNLRILDCDLNHHWEDYGNCLVQNQDLKKNNFGDYNIATDGMLGMPKGYPSPSNPENYK
jgi:hypothetical protein